MNITVDTIAKTITVNEDMTITELNREVTQYFHGESIDILRSYKILATKKVTRYVPINVYPSYPVIPYPYPYYQPYQPQPNPFLPPYTITCTIKGSVT